MVKVDHIKAYLDKKQAYFENEKGVLKMKIDTEKYGIEKGEHGYETGQTSEFLKTTEIGEIGKQANARIINVREIDFKDETKPAIDVKITGFQEDKTITLNKTNLCNLLDAFGEDTDEWIQKEIRLKVEKVIYSGKAMPGLRIYKH